ncbi:hypothetical protein TURU_013309 [Turdus rufiventris]|nr:hypothetical protein TURU_013309 [Turdus rufiventris]
MMALQERRSVLDREHDALLVLLQHDFGQLAANPQQTQVSPAATIRITQCGMLHFEDSKARAHDRKLSQM